MEMREGSRSLLTVAQCKLDSLETVQLEAKMPPIPISANLPDRFFIAACISQLYPEESLGGLNVTRPCMEDAPDSVCIFPNRIHATRLILFFHVGLYVHSKKLLV